MEVGIDTYVTVEDANRYVETYYPEYDDLAITWGVLSDREKTYYLYTSIQQMEALVLAGVRLDKNQPLQFPRKECFMSATRENPIIPEQMKEAQIENALELLNADLGARSDEQMLFLSSLGVIKNSKYNKREMGEVGLGETLTGAVRQSALESSHAVKLLKPWY